MPETTQTPDDEPATPKPRTPLPRDVNPWAIANDPTLDREAKLERLHQLEQDVRLTEVALEEGMTGSSTLPGLQEVLAALKSVAGSGAGGAPQDSDSKS